MHTTDAPAHQQNSPVRHYPQGRTRAGGIDLAQVLDWLQRNDYEQNAIGYAIQQIAKSGTADQMVALAAILRSELRRRTE
jgi:hypothetical protein